MLPWVCGKAAYYSETVWWSKTRPHGVEDWFYDLSMVPPLGTGLQYKVSLGNIKYPNHSIIFSLQTYSFM
jgi:hypothetical protein